MEIQISTTNSSRKHNIMKPDVKVWIGYPSGTHSGHCIFTGGSYTKTDDGSDLGLEHSKRLPSNSSVLKKNINIYTQIVRQPQRKDLGISTAKSY